MKAKFVYFVLLLMICFSYGFAQDRVITGKVTDEQGNTLSGVTVMVKGTAIGTFTKADGSFILKVPSYAKTIVFRRVGMKTKEVTLEAKDFINVALEEDKLLTQEIIVTAIGLEREKQSIGYAFEEVRGDIISQARTTNVVNSITGKVAGVQVVNSTGMPGASAYIQIRGQNSFLGGNQPLFIVDGIPIDNSMIYSGNPDNGTNNLLSGVAYSNRAIDLNPDDIESVTILKGPSATALYGIRASNGAVVITTKKGRVAETERINVSFSATTTIEEVNKLPELQKKFTQGAGGIPAQPGSRTPLSWGGNIDTLYWDLESTNRFSKYGNIVGKYFVDSINNPSRFKKIEPFDNLSNFFIPGMSNTQNLSMAGGTDFGSFFLSLSNSKSEGVVPLSKFERQTVRFNGEARISSQFKASGNVSYISSGGRRIQQGSNISGVMLGLLRTPISFDNSNGYGTDAYKKPDAYMFPDGTQRTYRGGGGYDNPYWTVARNPFFDNVDRFIGNIQLNYYFNPNIDLMLRVGSDIYSDKRRQEFAIYSLTAPAGQIFHHEIYSNDLTSDLILSFNYNLTDDLVAKFMLGNNLYQSKGSWIYTQGDGLIVPDFYHISNTTSQIVRQSRGTLRRLGFYGDLTLDYQQWLYFNGSLRNDMSTTLPKDKNSFWYGQGSLSVIFTNLFKDVFKDSFLNFGKIRFNYAVVGKDAPMYATTTPFIQASYGDGWTNGISFPFNNQVGFVTGDVLGNDKIRPEMTTSWEIGFNFAFLENLFSLDLTYYNSVSKDQIFSVPISRTTGYYYSIFNAGKISNKGFEAILNFTPINTADWRWSIDLNFSTNKNMVDELYEGIDNIFLGGFVGSSVRIVAGKPYGTIFGFGWARDSATGEILIDDNPNSRTYGFPIWDGNEKDFGTANPDWLLGLRNSVSWKGLTLSFLIDIKQGGKMWNGTKGALYYFGTHKDTEIRGSKKVFKGIKKTSKEKNDIEVVVDHNWYVAGRGSGFGNNTEDFIEDASWIRLRELSLSYTLPKAIVEYTPFSNIILTFTGRNLFLSTKYTGVDPETNLMGAYSAQGLDYFNMPGIRSYNFTIAVDF
ncbi:MAG: SusC/RagA family TonB-linked outer membrane protein [Ignavibacteria bacterium]|nr:SusC/RagA family TonB-linked outer membrane protein [Ignavibacteria bacterium]